MTYHARSVAAQELRLNQGEDRFIGEVLCDLTFMTKLQVRDVFESMEKAATGDE